MYNTEELRVARLAFLEDTIAYYSDDVSRRATTSYEGCRYRTLDTRKCAIGRYIPNDKYIETIEGKIANHDDVLALLPPKIAALSTTSYKLNRFEHDFLCDVQKLHDCDDYWSKNSLSKDGLRLVERIKQKYSLGESNG